MKLSAGAAGALFLLMSGFTSVASAAPGDVGTMVLYGEKGESDTNKCQLPMNQGKVVMGNSHGCKNDDYYYFKITLGQPGTIVNFYDSPSCNSSEPAYAYLITGGLDSELNMTAVSDLAHDGSRGKVLQKNLETYGSLKRGRLGGKLSCVVFSKY